MCSGPISDFCGNSCPRNFNPDHFRIVRAYTIAEDVYTAFERLLRFWEQLGRLCIDKSKPLEAQEQVRAIYLGVLV